ncbi:MAG: hypothetical protein ACRCZF_10350 [Gemmataceae bacterium]
MIRVLIAIVALGLGATAAPAQTSTYNALSTTGSSGSFTRGPAHFMQVVTLNVPNNQMSFVREISINVNWNYTGMGQSPAQSAFFNFYSSADQSPGASQVLNLNNFLGEAGYVVETRANGNYTLTFANIPFAVPKTFALDIYLLDEDFNDYSTELKPIFTTGTPTVGSNTGVVYLDNNLDANYTGADRTQFNAAGQPGGTLLTNIPVAMKTVPVPEPTLVGLGLVLVGGMMVRRRR